MDNNQSPEQQIPKYLDSLRWFASRYHDAALGRACKWALEKIEEADQLAALQAERDALAGKVVGLKNGLVRALDAAKSYRSDILGCSEETPNPSGIAYFDGLYYTPQFPGRDVSIAIAEAALAAPESAGEAGVREWREKAALWEFYLLHPGTVMERESGGFSPFDGFEYSRSMYATRESAWKESKRMADALRAAKEGSDD